MKEIRVHGRGGQGVVLASEIFVGALIKEGKYAASFPFFGFERRGAPIVAFVRFDERPIRQKDQIYAPDCVVVMDSTLLKAVDVYQGLKPQGILVLNGCRDIETLDLPPEVERVGLVDATAISLHTLKAFIPNTAMVGALSRTTGWVSLEALRLSLKENLPSRARVQNLETLQRAYLETKVFRRGEHARWH